MIGCIIQARMGSSRLPGKVMLNIDKKNPVIYYVIEQLKHCKNLEDIVVATTRLKKDDVIVEYLKQRGINVYRGSSSDVLDRYYRCAKQFSFSKIVRITCDDPLVDPEIVDKIINKFTKSDNFGVLSLLQQTPTCSFVAIGN